MDQHDIDIQPAVTRGMRKKCFFVPGSSQDPMPFINNLRSKMQSEGAEENEKYAPLLQADK